VASALESENSTGAIRQQQQFSSVKLYLVAGSDSENDKCVNIALEYKQASLSVQTKMKASPLSDIQLNKKKDSTDSKMVPS
jgi:hypothetical protein